MSASIEAIVEEATRAVEVIERKLDRMSMGDEPLSTGHVPDVAYGHLRVLCDGFKAIAKLTPIVPAAGPWDEEVRDDVGRVLCDSYTVARDGGSDNNPIVCSTWENTSDRDKEVMRKWAVAFLERLRFEDNATTDYQIRVQAMEIAALKDKLAAKTTLAAPGPVPGAPSVVGGAFDERRSIIVEALKRDDNLRELVRAGRFPTEDAIVAEIRRREDRDIDAVVEEYKSGCRESDSQSDAGDERHEDGQSPIEAPKPQQ